MDEPIEPKPPLVETPRLQVWHLMLMMAVAAVLMVLYRVKDWQGQGSPAFIGVWAFSLLAAAVAISVCVLKLAWRRRGHRYFESPGDSLGLTLVLSTVAGLPTVFLWHAYLGYDSEALAWTELPTLVELWFQWSGFVTWGLSGAAALILAARCTRGGWWRTVLVMLPVTWVIDWAVFRPLAYAFASNDWEAFYASPQWMLFSKAPSVFWLAPMALAVWFDHRQSKERSWTHWAGVGAFAFPSVITFVVGVGWMAWNAATS